MEILPLVSSVFVLCLALTTDAGQRCLDCTRIPFPRNCDHVTECGPHEVCHTMQLLSDSGHVFYDTGCLDSVRCGKKRMARNASYEEMHDETGDLNTCLECCRGDYCNTHGCGTESLQPFPEARGPVCFNCPKGTSAPGHCEIVTVCGIDEHCFIEPMVGIGGDQLYKTGCKKCQDISDIFVGKRGTARCSGCCKTDFCNHDCSSLSALTSTLSSSQLTPTKQATTHQATYTALFSTKITTPSPSSEATSASPTLSMTTTSTTIISPTSKMTTPSTPSSTLSLSPTLSMTTTSFTTTKPTSKMTTSLASSTHSQPLVTTPSEHTKEFQCLLLGYEYLKNFDHCVKPYKTLQLTWQHARDRCIQDGGDLLIYHDKSEESYFESWLKNLTGTKSRYWVGASDLQQEGTWLWVDSTAVDTNLYFYDGEPNDAEKHEDCAAATYHPDHRVLLNDDNCDLPSYFICEANLSGLLVQATDSSQRYCRNHGYTYDSQHGICFRVYDSEVKTMPDARASCQKEHADLLQLRDKMTELYFLYQGYALKDVTSRRYWLGASKLSDGQFHWFNGKRVTTTSYTWAVGEPNNYQNPEDCLEFRHYPSPFPLPDQYALNDANCDSKDYYICEERCPDKSYTYVPALDLCFKIYETKATWDEARLGCRVEHADLAEPNTLEKIEFFHKYLKTFGTTVYWIGGRESLLNPQTFIWQTSQQTIPSELWHTGEPNNPLEQCASLHWYNRADLDKLFRINDINCLYKEAYICQYIW